MERFPQTPPDSEPTIPHPEEEPTEARLETIGQGIEIQNMMLVDSEDSVTFRFRFNPPNPKLDQIGDLWTIESSYHPVADTLIEKGWMDGTGKKNANYAFKADQEGEFTILTYHL